MSESETPGGEGPPPSPFLMLLGSLAAQVQMALGLIEDPIQKKRIVEPAAARHGIELLAALEEKTKGNLDDDEAKFLATLLTQLRLLYVEVTKQAEAGASDEDAPKDA